MHSLDTKFIIFFQFWQTNFFATNKLHKIVYLLIDFFNTTSLLTRCKRPRFHIVVKKMYENK